MTRSKKVAPSSTISGGGLTHNSRLDGRGQPGVCLSRIVVGTAGDVNGDGYSDVIVGAHLSITARTTRVAYVYYGNGRAKPAGATVPQRRQRAHRPPGPLGQPDASAWRCWVARPLAAARSSWNGRSSRGASCSTERVYSAARPGRTPAQPARCLSELVGGLAQNTLYHWRVRVVLPAGHHPLPTV